MPGQAPPLINERELLLAYIAQQRDGIRNAAYGLTDEQARLTPSASSLSIGGLIKHVADMEKSWIDLILQRNRGAQENQKSHYEDNFRLGPEETLVDVLARYDDVAKETDAVIAAITDLGQAVPVPKGVPWFPDDVEAWSVRWVLLHFVEEIARHAGSRRHRAGVDRRRHHVRADGSRRGLAGYRLAAALGAGFVTVPERPDLLDLVTARTQLP